MAFWLYQMSEPDWSISNYRTDTWEGNSETWSAGKKYPAGSTPNPGDIMVLHYAESRASDYGIVGWGIILRYDEWTERNRVRREIRFRLTPPSDYLKTNPLRNDNISEIVNKIRGKPTQGTLWEIDTSSMKVIRENIMKNVFIYQPLPPD